jgi:hypothetical protein
LLPGTFEHALNYLIDHELDLSSFDSRLKNDATGACACARAERHLRHPDVGPVQGRNPLGLRFLRRFRLARTVEGDRLANERL